MRRCKIFLGISIVASLNYSSSFAGDSCSENLTLSSEAQDLLDAMRCIENKANAEGNNSTPERWVSIGPIQLGILPFRTGAPVAFDVSEDIVPSDAKEILVYVFISSGENSRHVSPHYAIYSSEGEAKFIKRFFWSRYPQDAVSFNSENLWLPLTSERKIFVQLLETKPGEGLGDAKGSIQVIGYR